jgi:hypothetical protein
VTWNGEDLPSELRELPAGRYVVEAVEAEAPALSAEEEAGIEAALESYRQGRVVDSKRAREIIDAALGALKLTYTEEAIADFVEAITYLNDPARSCEAGACRHSASTTSAIETNC